MLDWHSCQICYPLEIKILLLSLLLLLLSSQNFISRRFDGATAIFFKGDAF